MLGIESSILKVPSIYKVPNVNVGTLKTIVHSQGIRTSSPDYGLPNFHVVSLGNFLIGKAVLGFSY